MCNCQREWGAPVRGFLLRRLRDRSFLSCLYTQPLSWFRQTGEIYRCWSAYSFAVSIIRLREGSSAGLIPCCSHEDPCIALFVSRPQPRSRAVCTTDLSVGESLITSRRFIASSLGFIVLIPCCITKRVSPHTSMPRVPTCFRAIRIALVEPHRRSCATGHVRGIQRQLTVPSLDVSRAFGLPFRALLRRIRARSVHH